MEWDIMYNVARIYCSCKGTVDDIKENPGYAKVRSIDQKGRGYCLFTSYDSKYNSPLQGSIGYIEAEPVKYQLREDLKKDLENPIIKNEIKKAFKDIFQVGADSEVEVEPVQVKKDSVSAYFTLQSEKNGKVVVFECDNIASIHCQIDWPSEAEKWKETFNDNIDYQNGYIPTLSYEEASKIQHGGCHIIPKSIPNNPYSWRWSVSMAEAAVQSYFSCEQDLAFFITKVIFYNQKKKLDDRFSSFFIKNIAFNVFAKKYGRKNERKPQHPYKDKHSPNFHWDEVIWMVMVLLQQIVWEFSKKKKYIPHFFIQGCDLYKPLHSAPASVSDDIKDAFQDIIDNITNKEISLPCTNKIDDLIERIDSICEEEGKLTKSIHEEELKENVSNAINYDIISCGMKQMVPANSDSLRKIRSLQKAFKLQLSQVGDLDSRGSFDVSEFLLPGGRSLKIGRSIEIVSAIEQGEEVTKIRYDILQFLITLKH